MNGDEVVALFLPGFAGPDHAAETMAAAGELLAATRNEDGEPWIPVATSDRELVAA